jgi:hypothetical protein
MEVGEGEGKVLFMRTGLTNKNAATVFGAVDTR